METKKTDEAGICGFLSFGIVTGNALHSLQTFTRPTVAYVLEEKYDEDMEDDGMADPTIQLDNCIASATSNGWCTWCLRSKKPTTSETAATT
jgi:hypothetical protein